MEQIGSIRGAEAFALATQVARLFVASHPGTKRHYDDILSDACLGAVEALTRWDVTRGISLGAFSWRRINGEILDGVRRRAAVRRLPYAAGVRLEDLTPAQRVPYSLEEMAARGLEPRDPKASPTATVDARDALSHLYGALTAREYEVIVLYDLCGWRQHEVAARLHVTESRVSQIRREALTRMRLRAARSTGVLRSPTNWA